jgi:hypothetical protein
LGYPGSGGEDLTKGAETEARESSVAVVQDGQVSFWDEALAARGASPS